jgi:glutamate racemase
MVPQEVFLNNPILFLDSGIGGLPYYQFFYKKNKKNQQERVVYVADRKDFPYGSRPKEELVKILLDLTQRLVSQYKPKLAVMACNTASVTALGALREEFPALPWVGTVPAIKPAVMGSRTRRVGVLGTARTVEDASIAELAAKYAPDAAVIGIAAPDIVEFVEKHLTGTAAVGMAGAEHVVAPYIEQFRRAGADAVVLGCTHFLLLIDAFRKRASPDIKIYESTEGVSRRIETILDENNLRADTPGQNALVVTGDSPIEDIWYQRAEFFGLHVAPDAGGGAAL